MRAGAQPGMEAEIWDRSKTVTGTDRQVRERGEGQAETGRGQGLGGAGTKREQRQILRGVF